MKVHYILLTFYLEIKNTDRKEKIMSNDIIKESNKEKWWEVFNENKNDIRNIILQFRLRENDYGTPSIEPYTMEQFDESVEKKNMKKLIHIMNDCWFRAPDSRKVYSIPGFNVMCSLLDGSYIED
jgi:hypothetical protein